jgi:integrase
MPDLRHLWNRGPKASGSKQNWFLRLPIPRSLRRRWPMNPGKDVPAVIVSLDTGDLAVAQRKRDELTVAYRRVFGRLEAGETMTAEQIKAAAHRVEFPGPNYTDVTPLLKQLTGNIAGAVERMGLPVVEEDRKLIDQLIRDSLVRARGEASAILESARGKLSAISIDQGETINQALEAWLAEKASDKATKQRPQTIDGHQSHVRAFVDFYKGDLPLASIDRAKASDFLTSLKCGNRTRNNYAQTLKAIFESARQRGRFTGDNPFDKQRRKPGKAVRHMFTDQEAKRLIEAWPREIKPSKHSPETALPWVTMIAAYSGACLEEICQLTVADIKAVSGNGSSVTVIDIHNGDELHLLKNEETRPRKIPVHSALVRAGFLKYRDALPQDGPLFPGLKRRKSKGGKIGAYVGELFNEKRRALGIKRDKGLLDFHSWRHTVATKLRRAKGVAECDINDVLGHAQATESLRTYDHGLEAHHLKPIIEKIKYDE